CFQQELLPGNFGVVVEVPANVLGQPVAGRRGVGSGGRKSVMSMSSGHELFSFCQSMGPVRILGANQPGSLIDLPRQASCQGGESTGCPAFGAFPGEVERSRPACPASSTPRGVAKKLSARLETGPDSLGQTGTAHPSRPRSRRSNTGSGGGCGRIGKKKRRRLARPVR